MTGRRRGRLADDEIRSRLADGGSAWSFHDARLTRSFRFGTYQRAIRFVNEVARVAEEMDHHPEMTVTYREVVVTSWSHDTGGVTERDLELARRIDLLAPPS